VLFLQLARGAADNRFWRVGIDAQYLVRCFRRPAGARSHDYLFVPTGELCGRVCRLRGRDAAALGEALPAGPERDRPGVLPLTRPPVAGDRVPGVGPIVGPEIVRGDADVVRPVVLVGDVRLVDEVCRRRRNSDVSRAPALELVDEALEGNWAPDYSPLEEDETARAMMQRSREAREKGQNRSWGELGARPNVPINARPHVAKQAYTVFSPG